MSELRGTLEREGYYPAVGETLERIAKAFDTDVPTLLRLNPEMAERARRYGTIPMGIPIRVREEAAR